MTGIQADAVDAIVRQRALSASGERRLRRLLEGLTGGYSAFGLLGMAGLIWAASGVMAAVRVALNAAWDVGESRPFDEVESWSSVGLVLGVLDDDVGDSKVAADRPSA